MRIPLIDAYRRMIRQVLRPLRLDKQPAQRLPPVEAILNEFPRVGSETSSLQRVGDELRDGVGVHLRILDEVQLVVDEDATELIARTRTRSSVVVEFSELFGESAGASSDDRETHRHRFGDSDRDTFAHGREEEDIARGVELARVVLCSENSNVLPHVQTLNECFELVALVTVTEHDDYEIVVNSFEELFDDSREEEGAFLRVETTDDGDDDGVRRETKDGRLSGFSLGGSRRDEVGSFDTELDDADARGVDPPVLHEPGLEVVRAGDSAGEVALVDDRVTRVTAGLPAIVGFVVEVLRGRKLSAREERKETEGKKRTHVDEVDIRHLLDEGGEHLVNKLRVRNDDLLDSS
jgi:hypothetical protein